MDLDNLSTNPLLQTVPQDPLTYTFLNSEKNSNDSEYVPEYPSNCILYQNLNVRSSADITAIQSVDLKIVIQKYCNDKQSLENNDRVIIAKTIIHHLLVTNLNRM